MNTQLIEKLIRAYNETCPEIVFTNPLLDCKVSKALSKSFVKILTSKQNTSVDTHLRISVLENIRKICKLEPEGHKKVDENITELLTDFYSKWVDDSLKTLEQDNDKQLDKFLIRNIDFDIKPSYQININPEVIQSLHNLNLNLSSLSENLILLNTTDKQSLKAITNLWGATNIERNDIAIKIRNVIEEILFKMVIKVIENKGTDMKNFLNEETVCLFNQCSECPSNFQICSNILNTVLISSNFNAQIQNLITELISYIKLNCTNISILYPFNLRHIVILLDVNIGDLPKNIVEKYNDSTVLHLNNLRKKSETDLILLLSHFPQWFNIYFELR